MNILEAVLLGIIQGITEFLPISSTAHLTVAGNMMGLIREGTSAEWTATIAIIQLGTAAAVLLYFRRDLLSISSGLLSDLTHRDRVRSYGWSSESRLVMMIAIGTVPIVIIGLLFRDIIEGDTTKDMTVIACSLIGLALVLLWAEKVGRRSRRLDEKTLKDAIVVGLAQVVALIPGASRSGTTITAGLFLGFSREAAARFSFLLSIPAVLGSGLFELVEVWENVSGSDVGSLLVAVAVSAVTGYLSIAMLLHFLKNHSTLVFIVYRTALGLLILGFL